MNNTLSWCQIPILPLILACSIFSACASPQQRLTGAALLGDEAELADLLRPGAGDMAFAPTRNILFRTDRPIDQLLWLGDLQLLRSGAVLGRFEALKDPPKGMPEVHLTPVTETPFSSWRMAAAGGGDICVAGYNPRQQLSQIALLGPGAGTSGIQVLYETEAQIADVACDGKTAYFAAGGAVWKAAGAGRPAEVFYAQPRRAVRRIALNPAGGLFYGTNETVGYAGENARFDFMRCSRCRLAVAKGSLYILKDQVSGGVLRIEGVGAYSRPELWSRAGRRTRLAGPGVNVCLRPRATAAGNRCDFSQARRIELLAGGPAAQHPARAFGCFSAEPGGGAPAPIRGWGVRPSAVEPPAGWRHALGHGWRGEDA